MIHLKALGNALNFVRHLKQNDLRGYEDRAAAVSAIVTACLATRNLADALKAGEDTSVDGFNRTDVAELWFTAARLIGRFDTALYQEFQIKGYAWATDVWDDPEYPTLPRKVEEILADALDVMAAYQPVLSEKLVH